MGEVTHLSGRVLAAAASRSATSSSKSGSVTAGVYLAHRTRGRGHELSGFRPLPDQFDRRVLFPNHQAHPLSRPDAAHSLKVKKGGRELLTTQFFINGHPQNRTDGIFQDVGGPLEKELVLVDFKPLKESRTSELTARMDIVLGRTPQEPPRDRRRPAHCGRYIFASRPN